MPTALFLAILDTQKVTALWDYSQYTLGEVSAYGNEEAM
jgi:hypothetical protein